ncbi:MAG: hypothetical protein KIT10_06515 [Flavobacteriales bacterium]|nr:hypothetical protein [Flavobacteriales bacterium]
MMDALLDWIDRHRTGVMGTLVVHAVLFILLTIWTIRATPREEDRSEIRVEVVPSEMAEEMEERIMEELEGGTPREVLNLTSNITAETRPTWSEQRLSERVEQDLRRMEQQEFERLAEERRERGEEVDMPELDPSKWNKELYMDKAAEPVRIEGITTVWHDLEGRERARDVPGYLCRTQGRVAVRVQVASSGAVLKAELDPARSAFADDCMVEHALRSARRARFSPSANATDPQKGTVFFLFMPQ